MLKRTIRAVPELLGEITATWSKAGGETSVSFVSGEMLSVFACVYAYMAYTCFIFTVSTKQRIGFLSVENIYATCRRVDTSNIR